MKKVIVNYKFKNYDKIQRNNIILSTNCLIHSIILFFYLFKLFWLHTLIAYSYGGFVIEKRNRIEKVIHFFPLV